MCVGGWVGVCDIHVCVWVGGWVGGWVCRGDIYVRMNAYLYMCGFVTLYMSGVVTLYMCGVVTVVPRESGLGLPGYMSYKNEYLHKKCPAVYVCMRGACVRACKCLCAYFSSREKMYIYIHT